MIKILLVIVAMVMLTLTISGAFVPPTVDLTVFFIAWASIVIYLENITDKLAKK